MSKEKSIVVTKDLICELLKGFEGNSDDVVEYLIMKTIEPEDGAMAQAIRQDIKNKVYSRWADSYFIEDENQTWFDRKGADH